ncbi:hypothetical protein CesoFtcFv8_013892 [Champsocephalus esox]|uniref:Uncharacterized protein n=1 Tax=Champsocephalus esox TaxID=159716 RepID=A0AAN8BSL5_9TELE|nr:hypothetical protein CesoFtcFv8_013892 [Champsocephalus esox]
MEAALHPDVCPPHRTLPPGNRFRERVQKKESCLRCRSRICLLTDSSPLHDEMATSGDFPSELSPPRSPQLRSTARDQASPPNLQPVFSSSESSPQPERLSLEDLTGILSEPGHIPELLLDTAVPLSEEAPDSPAGPRPPDLPEHPIDMQGQAEVLQASGQSAMEEDEEDEEQRWERERKERLEQRQRQQEEARERELQELERLEKQTLLLEQQGQEEEEEEETGATKGDEELKQEATNDREESKGENPLEKYMKMVLEARGNQQAQSPGREEAGHTSPGAKSLSEGKDDSVAAYSHKDEEDDFW